MSKIEVTIGEQAIIFDVNNQHITSLLNNMQPNNKVAPFYNFLTATVTAEHKDALLAVIKDNSLATIEIGGTVLEAANESVVTSAKKL